MTANTALFIGIFVQNIVWFGVRGFTGASLGDFSRLYNVFIVFSRLFGIYTDRLCQPKNI